MKQFEKKYQLWTSNGLASYMFTEYDSLQQVIEAPKTGDWYVTKKVSVTVSDGDDLILTTQPAFVLDHKPQVHVHPSIITPYDGHIQLNNQPVIPADESKPTDDVDPAAEQLAAKYAAGPIGHID